MAVFQHSYAERDLDLYETPVCAVEARVRVGDLPHHILEPAAGRGAIVKVLRAAGHKVYASDVRHYDFPLDAEIDFLSMNKVPARTEMIMTNPPFMFAARFVERRRRRLRRL